MSALRLILIASILAIVGLLTLVFGPVWAASPEPAIPLYPPRVPALGIQEESASTLQGTVALSGLKAVLIVGPIDGDSGSWTTAEKNNMDKAARALSANGVEVHKFYAPYNDWNQIKAAANGAHFLMYRGHGVYMSGTNPMEVGGFALSNNVFKLSRDIRNDLKLARNAIVMLYGCFTAGSSSLDNGDIGLNEAKRRVVQYSDPFFDIGAGGYYANWIGEAFQYLVTCLFDGQTLGEAYWSYNDRYNRSLVSQGMNPEHPDNVLWLGRNDWRGYHEYNNAFSGPQDKTLMDLFGGMVVEPQAKLYLAEPSYPPHTYVIAVRSSNGEPFNWAATLSRPVGWMTAYPLSGSSGQDITVVITPTGMATNTYETDIQIVADDPKIGDDIQTSSVKLVVTNQIYDVYLPVVTGP